jgi:arsenite methyltransferase
MEIKTHVKDYYGKIIKKTDDLKTNSCCNLNSYPKKYYQNIHEEIKNSYYGCGLVVPDCGKGNPFSKNENEKIKNACC